MKGPGFRRDLDVRRIWKCPNCGDEVRLSGEYVAIRCRQCNQHPWMRIISERNAHPRPMALMSAAEIAVADFHLTEEELAKPLEGRIRKRNSSRGPNEAAPESVSAAPPTQNTAAQPAAEDTAAPPARPHRQEKNSRQRKQYPSSGRPQDNLPVPESKTDDDAFAAGLE